MSAVDVDPLKNQLFIVVHRKERGVDYLLAEFMAVQGRYAKPGQDIIHIDAHPTEITKPKLELLVQNGHCGILLGHLSEHRMGGNSMPELADMLLNKGLPEGTEEPIPLLFIGCVPGHLALDGSIENAGAELLQELGKRNIHVAIYAFNPSNVYYQEPGGEKENEWLTTILHHRIEANGLSWVYRGIPISYHQQHCNLTAMRAELGQELEQEKQKKSILTKDLAAIKELAHELKQNRRQTQSQFSDLGLEMQKLFQESIQLKKDLHALEKGLETPSNTDQFQSSTSRVFLLLAKPPSSAAKEQPKNDRELRARLKVVSETMAEMQLQQTALSQQLEELGEQIEDVTATLLERQLQVDESKRKIKIIETKILECNGEIDNLYIDLVKANDPWELATVRYSTQSASMALLDESLERSLVSQSAYDGISLLRTDVLKTITVEVPAPTAETLYTPPTLPVL
jgi:predicted nuclease with TOPRIM domain